MSVKKTRVSARRKDGGPASGPRRPARVAVLGAGYMGGALTFPLARNGLRVRLWGTWLDEEIIRSCRSGPHPKLGRQLPSAVELFESSRLAECVRSADCIIMAVASEGFPAVYRRLLEVLPDAAGSPAVPVHMTVTKGFVEVDGEVSRISAWARREFGRVFPDRSFRWASIGGPVKASELAASVPCRTVYGVTGMEWGYLPRSFATDFYCVHLSPDVIGVELSSAFKNVYAVASGICDGLYGGTPGVTYDNLRAVVFDRAVDEILEIVAAAGGRGETVNGLAARGDLFVTCVSGRNRRFGELVGRGVNPGEAYTQMLERGEVAEGYRTLELGLRYLRQSDWFEEIPPLLRMLEAVVLEESSPREALGRFLTAAAAGS